MYSIQNDEDGESLLFSCIKQCVCPCYTVTKKLPGVRKYVDPQNYASPESALKDFACEIPSHQLRLDEVIGGGEKNDTQLLSYVGRPVLHVLIMCTTNSITIL